MAERIWKKDFTIEVLNEFNSSCLPEHLDIKIIEAGDDYLKASMPVDNRTKQPMGLLHGGASVVLAETLGSAAGVLCLEDNNKTIVGVEINANHLRSARGGLVYGVVKPARIGRRLQVWNIEITDEKDQLICVSRLTVAVVDIK